MQNESEKEWLYERLESGTGDELSSDARKRLALLMAKSQNFDNFLANKFPSVKRYGGEGAEAMMGMFDELVRSAGTGKQTKAKAPNERAENPTDSLQSASRRSLSACPTEDG